MRIGIGLGGDVRGSGLMPGLWVSFQSPMTAMPDWMTAMGFTYTHNSTKYVLQDGALTALSANVFGTSYDPVTGLYGYMPEPAATNLLAYSEGFNDAYWSKVNASIPSTNNASPDGTNTASVLQMSTAAGHITRSFTATAAVHTFSMYVKKGNTRYGFIEIFQTTDHGYIFDFDNNCAVTATLGTPSEFLAVPIGNGWFRVSVTKTLAAAAAGCGVIPSTASGSVTRTNGDNMYIWGAQLETGSRATSYIKTAGATAARAADALSIPLSSISGFNSAGYTLFTDARTDMTDATLRYALSLSDTTANNYAAITRTAAGLMGTDVTSGGVAQVAIAESALSTTRAKTAFSCQSNNFLRAINGTAGTSDVSGTMPASPTTLYIGSLNGASQRNGYLFRVGLITKALTQTQVTALTS